MCMPEAEPSEEWRQRHHTVGKQPSLKQPSQVAKQINHNKATGMGWKGEPYPEPLQRIT